MRKEISAHEKWHLNRRTAMISTNNRNGNENVIDYMMTKEKLLQKLTEIEWDDFECKAPLRIKNCEVLTRQHY